MVALLMFIFGVTLIGLIPFALRFDGLGAFFIVCKNSIMTLWHVLQDDIRSEWLRASSFYQKASVGVGIVLMLFFAVIVTVSIGYMAMLSGLLAISSAFIQFAYRRIRGLDTPPWSTIFKNLFVYNAQGLRTLRQYRLDSGNTHDKKERQRIILIEQLKEKYTSSRDVVSKEIKDFLLDVETKHKNKIESSLYDLMLTKPAPLLLTQKILVRFFVTHPIVNQTLRRAVEREPAVLNWFFSTLKDIALAEYEDKDSDFNKWLRVMEVREPKGSFIVSQWLKQYQGESAESIQDWLALEFPTKASGVVAEKENVNTQELITGYSLEQSLDIYDGLLYSRNRGFMNEVMTKHPLEKDHGISIDDLLCLTWQAINDSTSPDCEATKMELLTQLGQSESAAWLHHSTGEVTDRGCDKGTIERMCRVLKSHSLYKTESSFADYILDIEQATKRIAIKKLTDYSKEASLTIDEKKLIEECYEKENNSWCVSGALWTSIRPQIIHDLKSAYADDRHEVINHAIDDFEKQYRECVTLDVTKELADDLLTPKEERTLSGSSSAVNFEKALVTNYINNNNAVQVDDSQKQDENTSLINHAKGNSFGYGVFSNE